MLAGRVVGAVLCVGTAVLAGACTSSPKPAEPALSQAQATTLQSALTTSDTNTVADVLAPPLRIAFQRHPFPLLPSGTKATIVRDDITVHGDAATVPVTLTGRRPGKWLLELVTVNGRWLVIGTVPA